MIRQILELSNQLCDQLGPFADNGPQLTGDLSSQCQEDIRVLVQLASDCQDRLLRWWRLFASLDLAQVRRFDSDPRRNATNGKLGAPLAALLTSLSKIVTESTHRSV
jgi:hypothetical protein